MEKVAGRGNGHSRRPGGELRSPHRRGDLCQARSVVNLREATADDIHSMVDISAGSRTAAQWTEQQYLDLFSPAASVPRLAMVAEAAPDPPGHPVTPDQAEGLLGFMVARFLAPECELENIVVSPAARRKGIGKQLLNALLRAASQTNCEFVFLEVRESNH